MANAVVTRNGRSNPFGVGEIVGGREKSFGDWAQCLVKTITGNPDNPVWRDADRPISELRDLAEKRLMGLYYNEPKTPLIRKYMTEDTGAGGGYTVPYEYEWGLMRDVAEDAIWWRIAYVQRMNSRTMELPLPDPTKNLSANMNSNLFGGIQMKWQGLPQIAANETEPSFRSVELVANMLSGICYSSNELVQDYQGLDDFLRRIFVRSVGWWTDQAFFQGPIGSGSPLGIVNAPGTILVARNAANAVAQADVSNMMKQLLPSSWTRAVWAVSPTAMAQIMNFAGLGGILYFIPGEDGSVGILYGRPMYVTEKLPDLGTTGDVCLFDASMYVVGHRDLLLDYSDQDPASFTQNKCAWRIAWRGDGTPVLQSSVTVANQSATKASPHVVLQ